jgi:hypothetical protein
MGVLHQVVVHCAAHAESAMVLSRACGAFVGRRLWQARGGATDGAHRGKSRDRTFSSAGLDDEDILASHALLDLNARLAALELVEQHLGRRYAEVVADGPARGQLTAPFTFTGATYSVSCGCELPPRTTMLRTMATGWWWGESSFQSLDGEQTGSLEKARKTLVDSLGPSRRGRWEQCILQELESMVNVRAVRQWRQEVFLTDPGLLALPNRATSTKSLQPPPQSAL